MILFCIDFVQVIQSSRRNGHVVTLQRVTLHVISTIVYSKYLSERQYSIAKGSQNTTGDLNI